MEVRLPYGRWLLDEDYRERLFDWLDANAPGAVCKGNTIKLKTYLCISGLTREQAMLLKLTFL